MVYKIMAVVISYFSHLHKKNYIKVYLHPCDSSCDIDVTEFKEVKSKFMDDSFVTDFLRSGAQYVHAKCEGWSWVKSLSYIMKRKRVAIYEMLKVTCR